MTFAVDAAAQASTLGEDVDVQSFIIDLLGYSPLTRPTSSWTVLWVSRFLFSRGSVSDNHTANILPVIVN